MIAVLYGHSNTENINILIWSGRMSMELLGMGLLEHICY